MLQYIMMNVRRAIKELGNICCHTTTLMLLKKCLTQNKRQEYFVQNLLHTHKTQIKPCRPTDMTHYLSQCGTFLNI